jgi:hypothetical protein
MSSSDENRQKRRDKKQHRKRHGQRGGTGKRSKLIQDIWVERAEEVKKKKGPQQPTKP